MMKIERIMVATDFSASGNRAIHEGITWAQRHAAEIRIIHVVPPKRWLSGLWGVNSTTIDAVHRHAADALRRAADAADPARRLQVSTVVLSGRASREIARAAHAFDSDLLVIGAHGERAALIEGPALGGTASRLVETANVPLLLVRKSPTSASNVVLAAVDLTPVSTAVLDWARAGTAGGRLHALHAYEVPFAERLTAYGLATATINVYAGDDHARRERQLAELLLSQNDASVERIVVRGDAVKHLFEHIRRIDASLVVLGQHERRTASTTVGSVCRYVATFSPTNVLVVPAH